MRGHALRRAFACEHELLPFAAAGAAETVVHSANVKCVAPVIIAEFGTATCKP